MIIKIQFLSETNIPAKIQSKNNLKKKAQSFAKKAGLQKILCFKVGHLLDKFKIPALHTNRQGMGE